MLVERRPVVVDLAESLTLRVGEATMTIWPTEDGASFRAAYPRLAVKRNGRGCVVMEVSERVLAEGLKEILLAVARDRCAMPPSPPKHWNRRLRRDRHGE